MSDGADDAQRKDVLLAIAGNDAAFARLVQAHGLEHCQIVPTQTSSDTIMWLIVQLAHR